MPNIIRKYHGKENPYLTIQKKTIRDKALNPSDLGYLVYLLAKPDDWKVRPEQLSEEMGTTTRTIYRALSRLMAAGYVKRVTLVRRTPDGRFDKVGFESTTIYTIFEDRDDNNVRTDQAHPDTTIGGMAVPF